MTVGPVLYVLDSYVELSQTFVREEIRELRRRGVTVHVVALSHGDTEPADDEPVTFLTETYRGKFPLGAAWASRAVRSPAATGRAAATLRALRSEPVPWRQLAALADDVEHRGCTWVHAHFGWLAAATAAVLSDLTGLPWSMTLHARDIFVEDRNLSEKLARVDHLVTVCRYNLAWMRDNLGTLPPTTIAVCGVAVPHRIPQRSPDGPDVIAVGRLVPKKGLDVLIDALPRVADETADLRVDVIGDGPLRGALEERARDLGVDRHIRFLGARPHDEVLGRISDAHVLCFPARIADDGDRDSMPVVVKEAMARAVPVVASDLVAIPEMIDDDSGVLVPPEDPGALTEALIALLSDHDRARRLGRAGRDRVREGLTLRHQVDRLLEVFASGGGS